MKKLPLHRRPYFCRRILEIGGGHDPYPVTHAVDKYPGDNSQRAGSMVLGSGVVFKEGELEAIPFPDQPSFDFLYASHVLEHVSDPTRAISEINRVAVKGYLETPSPLREQVACPYPFDPADFHTFFCWSVPGERDAIHVIRKAHGRVGEFCSCPQGNVAQALFRLRRQEGVDVEPMLPRQAKTTRLYFRAPIRLTEHASFVEACKRGHCAYASARWIGRWTNPPLSWGFARFRRLKALLKSGLQHG